MLQQLRSSGADGSCPIQSAFLKASSCQKILGESKFIPNIAVSREEKDPQLHATRCRTSYVVQLERKI